MEAYVTDFITDYPTYPKFMKNKMEYGKLPPKEGTMTPWEAICIDLIDPYIVTDRSDNDRILNIMACVDPATA